MLVALAITGFLLTLLITLALCKAASRADKWQDKLIEQRKKEEFEDYKWCDDECYRCDQNDWCKFSEVKKEGLND